MVWVGLTGGIASGKSTVSQMLKEAGAVIIDADEIAHDLLKKEGAAYHPVIRAFGTKIFDEAGEIDRQKLGAIVFRAPEKLMTLNKIVHPLVFEVAEQKRQEIASRDPHAVIVFDAPLLIETRAYKEMDVVLLVYVDKRTQIKRFCQRDNISEEEAQRRLDTQMPLDDKVPFANEVIDNDNPLEDVRKEVMRIYQTLQRVDTPRNR